MISNAAYLHEIKLTDDISLYYKKRKEVYFVELHDFANLCCYKNILNEDEFNFILRNPDKVFNYFELT
jgi:hypothetical protein